MKVTYIHHSGFLVETNRYYFIFDYETGQLPSLNTDKPIFVFSSHSHQDHYNPEIFSILQKQGMKHVRAILSDDIELPINVDTLQVSSNEFYELDNQLNLTTFKSTDLGVAFLIEDERKLIYHAGDLNDWVWDDESEEYNNQMTKDYQEEILKLSNCLNNREIDVAFVVLDPRQEQDYDRGMCFYLDNITSKVVYPMHYWDKPTVIDQFINDHPQYQHQIYK